MEKYLGDEKGKKKKRNIFKIVFFIALIGVVILPIKLGVFKSLMLPKSNQNQIYLWIDAPRDTTAQKMEQLTQDIDNFLLNNNALPDNLQIIESVSSTVGVGYVPDFANMFRGGNQRGFEYNLSARINLIPKEQLASRMTSEEFTIQIRKKLREYLLEKYPDIKIRLLEDPPGPPVMATFLINVKSNSDNSQFDEFFQKVRLEVDKVKDTYHLVDIGTNETSSYRKLQINIDTVAASQAGITTEQIASTLGIIFSSKDIGILTDENSIETPSLILGVNEEQKDSVEHIGEITFTNPKGMKIPLSSIATIDYDFVSHPISRDERAITKSIYAEMGGESVIYPAISLTKVFSSKDFVGENYKIDSWSPYKISYIGKNDGKKYTIEWSGEWKLTMDTFVDLSVAMTLSLLAIFFLLVGQFSSFRVASIIMITFVLSFFGIFPGFSLLYLLNGTYFSATGMIGIVTLGGIVVGNAIILIDYLNTLKKDGLNLKDALLEAGYIRFAPILLTSLTTICGAATIVGDPVWAGVAWSIVWGLALSSILTLIVVPIFYYDAQKEKWIENTKSRKITEL